MRKVIGSGLWMVFKCLCKIPRGGWFIWLNPFLYLLGRLAYWLDPEGEPRP